MVDYMEKQLTLVSKQPIHTNNTEPLETFTESLNSMNSEESQVSEDQVTLNASERLPRHPTMDSMLPSKPVTLPIHDTHEMLNVPSVQDAPLMEAFSPMIIDYPLLISPPLEPLESSCHVPPLPSPIVSHQVLDTPVATPMSIMTGHSGPIEPVEMTRSPSSASVHDIKRALLSEDSDDSDHSEESDSKEVVKPNEDDIQELPSQNQINLSLSSIDTLDDTSSHVDTLVKESQKETVFSHSEEPVVQVNVEVETKQETDLEPPSKTSILSDSESSSSSSESEDEASSQASTLVLKKTTPAPLKRTFSSLSELAANSAKSVSNSQVMSKDSSSSDDSTDNSSDESDQPLFKKKKSLLASLAKDQKK